MAIEYLYDVIRAVSGEDALITALITENDEVAEAAGFHLYDQDLTELFYVPGQLDEQGLYYEFPISGEVTKYMKGRYLYNICDGSGGSRCFYQPIYFV